MKTHTRKKKLQVVLIIIIGLVLALMLKAVIVWFASDKIISLGYYGLENMFHVENEYYAVAGPFKTRIPKVLAQSCIDTDIDYIGDTSKEVGNNYFVSIDYSEDKMPLFYHAKTLPHSYDDTYIFEVHEYPGYSISQEEEQILLDIASHFYDFSKPYIMGKDNWIGNSGESYVNIFCYDVYIHDDKVFFEIDLPGNEGVLYSYHNKTFTKVMTKPSRTSFDWVVWKD